jgi:ATP-dependent protease ClpP protease subunit
MKTILSFILAMMLVVPATAENRRSIVLTPENTVNVRGVINAESMVRAQMRLSELSRERGGSNYPIYIVLDSPGGSIMDGEDFIRFANMFRNVHTITIFAASMAAAIVQGIPGQRLISERGEMMFHRAKGRFQGQFEAGEVESRLLRAKALVLAMETRNANRMKLPILQYKQQVINELWLYGAANIPANAADEVVRIVCNRPLIDERETHVVAMMFGATTSIFSGCPLIRNPLPNDEEK